MGYNHAAAFLPVLPRPKFFPPFEGPVKGFKNLPEAIKGTQESLTLLDLRTRWLDEFLASLKGLSPEIPRDVAVEWVNHFFPKTAEELAASMTTGEPQKLAFRLADAWDAA